MSKLPGVPEGSCYVGELPQEGSCVKCGKPFHVRERPCCCGSPIDVIRDGRWVAERFDNGQCASCCTHDGFAEKLAIISSYAPGRPMQIDAVGTNGCKATVETR